MNFFNNHCSFYLYLHHLSYSFDLYILWIQTHWILQTLHISPSCATYLYVWFMMSFIKPQFFFLRYSNSLSLMVQSSFLDLLKKALHILLYFLVLKSFSCSVLKLTLLLYMVWDLVPSFIWKTNSLVHALSLLIENAISSTYQLQIHIDPFINSLFIKLSFPVLRLYYFKYHAFILLVYWDIIYIEYTSAVYNLIFKCLTPLSDPNQYISISTECSLIPLGNQYHIFKITIIPISITID